MTYRTIIPLVFCITYHFNCFAQSFNKSEVDSLFEEYVRDSLYVNASNLLVDYAKELESIGDKETALKYQLSNCDLIESNLDYFFQHGLSLEGYFADKGVVGLLYIDLGYKNKTICQYLSIVNQMRNMAPNLLLKYSEIFAPTLSECTDSTLCDSISVLSYAMDYIIQNNEFTKKDIEDFAILAKYINMNRIYNNKMEDCDEWFNRYSDFVINLDTTAYKDYVLDFFIEYVDILELRASNASARENDNTKAIIILNKANNVLNTIVSLDSILELRIASNNAKIGHEYLLLNNKIKAKEFNETALSYLMGYKGEKDQHYCDILSSLAFNFLKLNQLSIAANLKKAEITARENTIITPQLSDYAVLMVYNVENPVENIDIGDFVINQFGDSCCNSMVYVYMKMADAYSMLMEKCSPGNNSYEINKLNYEFYIERASQTLGKISPLQHTIASFYSIQAKHSLRIGENDMAFKYAEKAYLYDTNMDRLYLICQAAAASKNNKATDKYLPIYYEYLTTELKQMLPILGTVETEPYLQYGGHPIYSVLEWALCNPNDSTSASIAYNTSLLLKGLYLNSSSLMPYLTESDLLKDYYALNALQDSVYRVQNANDRVSFLIDLEKRERQLRLRIINKIISELSIKWTDIQNSLHNDEVAIEIVEYATKDVEFSPSRSTRYAALIVDKKSLYPLIVDLFSVDDIKSLYESQPQSYSSHLSTDLYNKLWGKLLPYINGASKVYFAPIGLMSLVGVEYLVDENGNVANRTFPLIRVSSTKEINSKNNSNKIKSISLFGGINYTNNDSSLCVFALDSLNTRGNWSFLSETLNEITSIEKHVLSYKNIIVYKYVGDKATERVFKENCLKKPSIVHIATHGFYIPYDVRKKVPYYKSKNSETAIDNLFYSGLVFSGGQDTWNDSTYIIESNDGILSSYEISKLDFRHTDIIFLSACETGIGDLSYDGVIGLQRALKKAGANALIMSLWKVDDYATSIIAVEFYKNYLSGKSARASLYAAQDYVRNYTDENGNKLFESPYYWAGFILLDALD